jgi:hypothetical protein
MGHDLEDGSYRNHTSESNQCSNRYSRRKLWFGIAVSAVISSAITIPIVLNHKNNDSNNNLSSNAVVSNNETDSVPKDASTASLSKNSSTSGTDTEQALNFNTTESKFATSNGPFNANIELLSANVVSGYKDDEDLKEGITNAANFYLGNIYKQYSFDQYGDETNIMTRSATKTSSSDPGNDFGTRNQELGIEEGDIIVSDGTYGTYSFV